ncbi:hypothetical protein FA95DRAFT_1529237 [Auriscalpium vulgare]|uniref:Uncharacterized protein n=1 Tax=Auriscalpium vulgare TaxID=40419 RepID=A0ACB8R323_9AGAM|nr:hypothetical protein FA95DRAFT_1529237 [Auriscalpium vulgare]
MGFVCIYSDASIYVFSHAVIRVILPVFVDDGRHTRFEQRLYPQPASRRAASSLQAARSGGDQLPAGHPDYSGSSQAAHHPLPAPVHC